MSKEKKERRHQEETDCRRCGYPHRSEKRGECRDEASSLKKLKPKHIKIISELQVKGLGAVPVLRGDPKVLPSKVLSFIAEKALLMRPAGIFICSGSLFEASELAKNLEGEGQLQPLFSVVNGFLSRSDPADVARVESKTFIVAKQRSVVEAERKGTSSSEFARYMSEEELRENLEARFPGASRGRILYVIPFSMGPIGGRHSLNAVQVTDSALVVLHMRLMTRVSSAVWDAIGNGDFLPCVHSLGSPRPVLRPLINNWPCRPQQVFLAHDLSTKEIWSFGSGYGGNALLGKKSLALRIASFLGKEGGWFAEHAAILSITNPKGEEFFVCAQFPSGCGKTSLAFLTPALEGWKVRVLGDDIAWLHVDADGRLRALNPENGFFGIPVGVNEKTNPKVLKMLKKNVLFLNTASTSRGRPFWQGLDLKLDPGEKIVDWRGKDFDPSSGESPAHPNARFTVQCEAAIETLHELWDSPKGVPISAYLFGGRRHDAIPLVREAPSWTSGVLAALTMRTQLGAGSERSETTAVHDPMGMRAFLSYNLADYTKHWLGLDQPGRKLPKIFFVNWYQKDVDGKALWPGFGENIRVLEWITKRVASETNTPIRQTPVGHLPLDLNLSGLEVDWSRVNAFDTDFWKKEVAEWSAFVDEQLGPETPPAIRDELLCLRAAFAL